MSLHKRIAHPIGILALKAKLQEDYAIKGVGNLVKQVGFLCQKCRHDKQKAATQQMAPLPKFRSSIPLRAFARTGLDFAGPFLIKVGRCKARKKASVFVLTCLNTRAIHLEVCPSQDTNAVINALSRFCDLRGVPELIISDNQTSFRSTSTELENWVKQIDFETIKARTSYGYKDTKGIQWNFNPPLAPHFGGIFEIMVKATKRALVTLLGGAEFDEDEFKTAISGCMSLLNSHPIAQLSSELDAPPLTPNHFLHGMCGGSLAPPMQDEDQNPIVRWRKVQSLISSFWSSFMKELIPMLQVRKKWLHPSDTLKVMILCLKLILVCLEVFGDWLELLKLFLQVTG
jgi:hypothetical protein